MISPKKDQKLDDIKCLLEMTSGMVRFLKRYTLKMATKQLCQLLCNACAIHCRCRSSSSMTFEFHHMLDYIANMCFLRW